MEQKQFIQFQEGWDYMEKGITKLKRILEGESEQFRSDKYMHLYSKIYNMCTQKPPYEYSKLLYEGDEGVFVEYTNSTVLPSLREKHGEFMLG